MQIKYHNDPYARYFLDFVDSLNGTCNDSQCPLDDEGHTDEGDFQIFYPIRSHFFHDLCRTRRILVYSYYYIGIIFQMIYLKMTMMS